MRTVSWTIQGGRVHSSLKGQVITGIKVPETYAEAETLVKNGQSDVVAKFADGRIIGLQGKLRTMAEKVKEDGSPKYTLADLQKAHDEYLYSVQAEGTPKSIKPETKQNRQAASVGNRLFDRMASDDKFRAQMFKNGVADEAEFNEWLSARDEAAAKAAAEASEAPTA